MTPKTLLPVAALGILTACAPAPEKKAAPEPAGTMLRVDPAFDAIAGQDALIEKLAGGFQFTEGPVWIHDGGYLLFSDIPNNVINKWTPDGAVTAYREYSGYEQGAPAREGFLGSNGLTLDTEGRLIVMEMGNRRVTRIEKDGSVTVLADKYQGKKLNSPNDAVFKSDGWLYFTDPPYGLGKQDEDPLKELDFNGVYRWKDGKLELLAKDMTRPNGIAFSPDEKYLYVANSDPAAKYWRRYEVKADGTLGASSMFFDVTSQTEEGLPDGMKVDKQGNVYGTGPGGVWVLSGEGKHLGTIKPTEVPANCHWGDADGKTLYMTARTGLYRVRLNVEGVRP